MPGTGKTRVLGELARRAAALRGENWVLLDNPSPELLRAQLAACGGLKDPAGRRLLIASRSSSGLADLLLTPRLYGFVDVIDDGDLFVNTDDCRSMPNVDLLAATGGWPLLVDGYLTGRAPDMVQMLPAFLDREVLPDLSSKMTTALFGALPA